MFRLILSLSLAGALSPSAWAIEAPASVQQTALAFVDALKRGDQKAAEARVITFSEWTAMSKRSLSEREHSQRHLSMVRALAAELGRKDTTFSLELKDVLLLPEGKKTRGRVTMAVFHASLGRLGAAQKRPQVIPLLFVQVGDVWKFMVRD